MHNIHAERIFIVCNRVICTNLFNILSILYNGHACYFVYSSLNSYFIYIIYYVSSVYIPFSDRVGIPLHNILLQEC